MQEYFQPGEGNQELRPDRRAKFYRDFHETIASQVFEGKRSLELQTEDGDVVTVALPPETMIADFVSVQRQSTFALITMELEVIAPEWAEGMTIAYPLEYKPPAINDDGTYVLTPKDNRSTNAS